MSGAVFAAEATPVASMRVRGARDDEPPETSVAPSAPLFVVPSGAGNGLQASIRGHRLELADPESGHGLAPTPDDLRTTAVASSVAWFARRFLRERGLDDYVSVTTWPSADRLDVSVTVSRDSAGAQAMLSSAPERECRPAFSDAQVRFQVTAE